MLDLPKRLVNPQAINALNVPKEDLNLNLNKVLMNLICVNQ